MATMSATSAGQDVARRLMDDGYVVVTGMLTPPGAQAARADLDRVLRTTRTGRNSFEGFDTQRIYALFAKTRTFDALATDPLLLDVLDQVLGHYQLSAPVGIFIGPGEKAQILHRDGARGFRRQRHDSAHIGVPSGGSGTANAFSRNETSV